MSILGIVLLPISALGFAAAIISFLLYVRWSLVLSGPHIPGNTNAGKASLALRIMIISFVIGVISLILGILL